MNEVQLLTRPLSWYAGVRRDVLQLGFLNAMLYYVHRVLSIASQDKVRIVKYLIVAQPVSAPQAFEIPASSDFRYFVLSGPSPLLLDSPRPIDILVSRLEKGSICIVATMKRNFAGYIWLSYDAYDEDEVRCRYEFPKGECAWDYDVYVAPRYRIGRVFARLWMVAQSELHARHVEHTLSRISAFNAQSIASHKKLGARRLMTLTFLCLGPLEIVFRAKPPYVSISLSERNTPVLQIKREDLVS